MSLLTSPNNLQAEWNALVNPLITLPFDCIYLFIITKLCFWYALAFTSARSPLRPVFWVIIAITGLAAVRSPKVWLVPGAVACDWIIGVIIHASNFLLIAQRVPPPEATTFWSKAYWAFLAVFAGRWNVPHPPKFSAKNPSYVPSRARLFIGRAVDSAICFTIASLLEQTYYGPYPDPGGFFSRLNEVTGHELTQRVFLTVKGMVIPYLGLRACHCFATCVALLFGAAPEDWPPLYGSVKEAYTVRRFYSHFWHHAMRRALTAHASLLTYYLIWFLSLSKPKTLQFPAARVLITILTFAASAGMHVLTCPWNEIRMIQPELWLHLGTAGVIILEDAFIQAYKQARRWLHKTRQSLKYASQYADSVPTSACATVSVANGQASRRTSSRGMTVGEKPDNFPEQQAYKEEISYLWRGVGYIWTACFWTWAVSGLMYSLYN